MFDFNDLAGRQALDARLRAEARLSAEVFHRRIRQKSSDSGPASGGEVQRESGDCRPAPFTKVVFRQLPLPSDREGSFMQTCKVTWKVCSVQIALWWTRQRMSSGRFWTARDLFCLAAAGRPDHPTIEATSRERRVGLNWPRRGGLLRTSVADAALQYSPSRRTAGARVRVLNFKLNGTPRITW